MNNQDEALRAVDNLYGLLLEMNYYKEPEDFIEELENEEAFVSKHLKKIKLKRAKNKAFLKQKQYADLREEFIRLREYGVDKLKALMEPSERLEMQPLFNKFEDLDEDDIIDINNDQDFLIFMSKVKSSLEKNES